MEEGEIILDQTAFFPLFPGLKELVELYGEVDSEIHQFKIAAELDCIKFCRQCCATEGRNIEVSPFECLPLSIHLWQTENAEMVLQRIGEAKRNHPCVLYDAEGFQSGGWGCPYYPWRPMICRLFGFSAILDKRGRAKIALCRAMKKADPEAEERTNQRMAGGVKAPVLSHLARKAFFLNPNLGKRYPINEGLRIALEKVGLELDLIGRTKGPKESPGLKRND